MQINELLKDRKTLFLCERYNSINRIMQIVSMKDEDGKDIHLENSKYNKKQYKLLEWSNSTNFDVINSFWTVFSYWLIYNIKPQEPRFKYDEDMFNYYSGKRFGYRKISKGKLYEKFLNEKNENCHPYLKQIQDTELLAKFAELTHSIANFMPCPDHYNSDKGILEDVRDFFPLMINKIQDCVNKSENQAEKENWNKWHEWHKWFADNCEKYKLGMYYRVEEKENERKIVGKPLFEGQTLENPVPKNKEETDECILNMIKRIIERAFLLSGVEK